MKNLENILGFIGAGLFLLAYFQVSRGAWQAEKLTFQLCNLLGAILLVIYSWYLTAWANVVLDFVWGAIALGALIRLGHPKKS